LEAGWKKHMAMDAARLKDAEDHIKQAEKA
jgi:hypothetical protein